MEAEVVPTQKILLHPTENSIASAYQELFRNMYLKEQKKSFSANLSVLNW